MGDSNRNSSGIYDKRMSLVNCQYMHVTNSTYCKRYQQNPIWMIHTLIASECRCQLRQRGNNSKNATLATSSPNHLWSLQQTSVVSSLVYIRYLNVPRVQHDMVYTIQLFCCRIWIHKDISEKPMTWYTMLCPKISSIHIFAELLEIYKYLRV